jgi:hypothetical protein
LIDCAWLGRKCSKWVSIICGPAYKRQSIHTELMALNYVWWKFFFYIHIQF